MASGPITSWGIDGETVETVSDFIFWGGSKITADGDHSHEIKRHMLFGKEAMTNLDSILKSREEQDGRGVGGHGVHLSPQIHQEYIFRHRSACRTPADRGQEYLSSGKEYTEPRKTRYDEETSGEDRSVSWTGPALSGWGN